MATKQCAVYGAQFQTKGKAVRAKTSSGECSRERYRRKARARYRRLFHPPVAPDRAPKWRLS